MKKRVLSLNKTTIANLQKVEQSEILGGAAGKVNTGNLPPAPSGNSCNTYCPPVVISGDVTCNPCSTVSVGCNIISKDCPVVPVDVYTTDANNKKAMI